MSSRIAFYAPLKPPGHKTPSGDRRMARLLIRALYRAGYSVTLASALRSRNGNGDPSLQDRIEARAKRTAARLTERYRTDPPDLFFTYHSYYKAPDLIGPAVAKALNIPYAIAEASHAPVRVDGPWARGHALAEDALRRVDIVFHVNPKDRPGVALVTRRDTVQTDLPPFVDARAEARFIGDRDNQRRHWANALELDPAQPWLIATAMMRRDAKLESYRVLAEAARHLTTPCQLILVGDGPARVDINELFESKQSVRFAGQLELDQIRSLNVACDLFTWPALKEAFGLASLEAQAAGLPAVLGDRPGTRAFVQDGMTARLIPEGDAEFFTQELELILANPERRRSMGEAARAHVLEHHDIGIAASLLKSQLDSLTARRASP